MAPTRNACFVFLKSIESAAGYPVNGKTFAYDDSPRIDLDKAPLNGGALVKTLVLSIDPYMRGKMQAPDTKSYTDMYVAGQPLSNFGVGVVLRSDSTKARKGDHLYGYFPFQEYSVQSKGDLDKLRVLKNKEGLPWSLYVGVLGMPGKTAVFGWKEFSKAEPGQTLFVTTGAGQVGSLVIQLARRDGLKVIGSAGSADKVKFMKTLGASVAFNYKDSETKTKEVLDKHGPIDIYWDSVGGKMLDDALAAASHHARFIECGMISGYNGPGHPITNIENVLTKSITMTGFIVMDLEKKYDEEFYDEMPRLIKAGKYEFLEDIRHGLEHVGDAIIAVQKGDNKGKSVIVLADQ
ncbi:hypothetical protein BDZ94DRAFT_535170 [Collybia nuda]|uniref:Enoyl reductase (ER) domain-containing protein n=1 Tax=Collybia nuda TaxID=64659 RepID=A0A9P5YAD2_9AGAR|nr:hypothetical protein BDZ94DRAFT_535170 [Collybia nuda]